MIYASLKHKDKELLRRAQKAAIDVKYQPDSFFSRPEVGAVVHQGLMARLRPFKYCSLEALLTPEAECILVLDEIVDPRNLGALLRSAESCRVDGVILTNRRSAKISPAAEKAAAGAAAYLRVCRVENLKQALNALKSAGFWVFGLTASANQSVFDMDLKGKAAFVLGGEERGLRRLVEETCDHLISIPMLGKLESLNVSVAGAIVIFERVRQRGDWRKDIL